MPGREPLFTVVIPTRNRPELAAEALKSASAQTMSDYEVLVLENSDPDKRLTGFPSDPRFRNVPSERILSMPDNWERLLDHARGKYVIVVADKDRLLPSALARLRDAVAGETPVATFRKAWFQGGALSELDPPPASGYASLPAKPFLDQWFSLSYSLEAPMLYNSAVKRELLLELRASSGRLFHGSAPDVCSSVLILATTQGCLAVQRPLVVSHYGPWSNGIKTVTAGRSPFAAEFGADPFQELGLVYSTQGVIAETLYRLKELFPVILAGYDIDWTAYATNVARELLYSRESMGVDTSEDWDRLVRAAGRLYPWNAVLPALALRVRRRTAQRFRKLLPSSGSAGRLVRRSMDRIGARRVPPARPTRVMPLDAAIDAMETLNAELDRTSLSS